MGAPEVDAGLYIPLPETEVVGCLSDGAHNGGGLNGQDAYTGRILATVAPSLSIGFSVKDYGADAQENIAPTLRAMNHTDSHANGGGQLGVVAPSREPAQGSFPWPQEVADPLTSNEAKTYTQEGSHNFRTRNVVPHDFDGVAEPSPEPQGFYTTDGRFNGIPPAGLSPPLKVGTGTGGTGNTGAAYLASDALAFNGYQRTVSRVASPITASDYKKVEIGVLTFVDEDADEPPAYCYPDADQLGYAPGDEVPAPVEARVAPPPAYAVALRGREGGNTAELGGEIQPALRTGGGGSDKPHVLVAASQDPFVFDTTQVTHSANLKGTGTGIGKEGDVMFTLQSAQPHGVALSFNQRDEPRFSPVAYSLQTQPGSDEQLVMESARNPSTPIQDPFVFDTTQVTHPANYSSPKPGDPSRSPQSTEVTQQVTAVLEASQPRMVVRRLTPRECERLQGFADDWTLIPWKNKPAVDCPDGPRYKALGNSMAVPCMRWIGRRIDAHVKGTSP